MREGSRRLFPLFAALLLLLELLLTGLLLRLLRFVTALPLLRKLLRLLRFVTTLPLLRKLLRLLLLLVMTFTTLTLTAGAACSACLGSLSFLERLPLSLLLLVFAFATAAGTLSTLTSLPTGPLGDSSLRALRYTLQGLSLSLLGLLMAFSATGALFARLATLNVCASLRSACAGLGALSALPLAGMLRFTATGSSSCCGASSASPTALSFQRLAGRMSFTTSTAGSRRLRSCHTCICAARRVLAFVIFTARMLIKSGRPASTQ